MGKTHVKNGTPVGNRHLCTTCRWGQSISGYRESELLVICNYTSPHLRVPFTVYECSQYEDAHKPTWEQMEKLAIRLAPTRTSKRTAGFSVRLPLKPIAPLADEACNEDEDALEVARLL
jgi:hypothetical protein